MWETEYFDRSEFRCGCGCSFDTPDYALVNALHAIREHFGQPVTITSACRCDTHNRVVGGSKNSQHIKGRAADIQVKDVDPRLVAQFADDLGLGGVGDYPTFTHIDTRQGRARWEA